MSAGMWTTGLREFEKPKQRMFVQTSFGTVRMSNLSAGKWLLKGSHAISLCPLQAIEAPTQDERRLSRIGLVALRRRKISRENFLLVQACHFLWYLTRRKGCR